MALILYLKPEQAALLLSGLPAKQADIVRRIALMTQTSPEVIRDVERILEKKVSSLVTQDYTNMGGVETVVGIINRVDRSSKRILNLLSSTILIWQKKLSSKCSYLMILCFWMTVRYNVCLEIRY